MEEFSVAPFLRDCQKNDIARGGITTHGAQRKKGGAIEGKTIET